MNVTDIQRQLDSLVRLLEDGGAKVARDLASFRTGLNPFGDMSLKEFSGLLDTMAAFRRDGQLVQPGKRGSAKSGSKGPKEAKADPAALAAETKLFYERVTAPAVEVADIDALIARLEKLTAEGLRPVAAVVGVVVGKKIDKKRTLADIKRHIQERKGASQRADHLLSGANGASGSGNEPIGITFENR